MSKTLNILLVDDDIVDIMNMKRAFAKKGFQHPLYIAHNGDEAMQMLEQQLIPVPHVILLDLNMPKMGGVEFLEIIRKHPAYKHIHVVVLTTSDEDADKFKAHRHNISSYLIKPLSGTEFSEQVDTLNNSWEIVSFPD
ncbi:MAG: response regulator [Bacteroidota bacterium]